MAAGLAGISGALPMAARAGIEHQKGLHHG
jgi:hypothetical protein